MGLILGLADVGIASSSFAAGASAAAGGASDDILVAGAGAGAFAFAFAGADDFLEAAGACVGAGAGDGVEEAFGGVSEVGAGDVVAGGSADVVVASWLEQHLLAFEFPKRKRGVGEWQANRKASSVRRFISSHFSETFQRQLENE